MVKKTTETRTTLKVVEKSDNVVDIDNGHGNAVTILEEFLELVKNGKFQDVVIIGMNPEDTNVVVTNSFLKYSEINWMLDLAKYQLMFDEGDEDG